MGITSYQTQHHKANHVLRVSEFRSGELSDPLSLGLARFGGHYRSLLGL